jgi:hypothetical protein
MADPPSAFGSPRRGDLSWKEIRNAVLELVAKKDVESPGRLRRKVLELLDAQSARSLLAPGREKVMRNLLLNGYGRDPISQEKARKLAAAVSSAARSFLGREEKKGEERKGEEKKSEELPSDSGKPSRESMRMKPQQAGFRISGSTLAMGAAGLGLLLAVKKAMNE